MAFVKKNIANGFCVQVEANGCGKQGLGKMFFYKKSIANGFCLFFFFVKKT